MTEQKFIEGLWKTAAGDATRAKFAGKALPARGGDYYYTDGFSVYKTPNLYGEELSNPAVVNVCEAMIKAMFAHKARYYQSPGDKTLIAYKKATKHDAWFFTTGGIAIKYLQAAQRYFKNDRVHHFDYGRTGAFGFADDNYRTVYVVLPVLKMWHETRAWLDDQAEFLACKSV